RLATASGRTVTADYLTADGSATAGAEFIPVADTLTFTPGETIQTLAVPVNGGVLNRNEGTFSVILTNAVNAIISRPLGTATVMSDRPVLALLRNVRTTQLLGANATATNSLAPLTQEAPSKREAEFAANAKPLSAASE